MAKYAYLDASTGYLTEREAQELEDGTLDWVFDAMREGWWVWVPSDPTDLVNGVDRKLEDFPGLRALIVYARSQGCNWILFDSDGDTDLPDEFPTHEW